SGSSRSSNGLLSSCCWISASRSMLDSCSRRMACCNCGVIDSCCVVASCRDGFMGRYSCSAGFQHNGKQSTSKNRAYCEGSAVGACRASEHSFASRLAPTAVVPGAGGSGAEHHLATDAHHVAGQALGGRRGEEGDGFCHV